MTFRFVWVRISFQFVLMKARWRGDGRMTLTFRPVTARTRAGVKGAITLAGILKRLRLAGIEAERQPLHRLRRCEVIDDMILRWRVREIDPVEASLVALEPV